jgi:hypothetical protein
MKILLALLSTLILDSFYRQHNNNFSYETTKQFPNKLELFLFKSKVKKKLSAASNPLKVTNKSFYFFRVQTRFVLTLVLTNEVNVLQLFPFRWEFGHKAYISSFCYLVLHLKLATNQKLKCKQKATVQLWLYLPREF